MSLGISTGFERFYGVLKRLGATPLGRPRWVLAKFAAVLTIEFGQWAILIPTGLLLGWSPAGGWPTAVLGAVLGTAAFGGLALFMAGTLGGMTNLAACNGIYLALMVTGGMVVPFDKMPEALQAMLLRVLEDGTYRRVGSTEPRHADIRVLSATHRHLDQMVRDGRFREDLYYRLSTFPITLPPVRPERFQEPWSATNVSPRYFWGKAAGPTGSDG